MYAPPWDRPWFPLMEEPIKLGMILAKTGLSVGKQAARMAVVTSRYDQVAASTLSQLGSSVEAAILRVRMRIMEMMQVLSQSHVSTGSTRKISVKMQRHLQEPKAKDRKEHHLLFLGQLEGANHRQRQAENGEIGDQVEGGHDIPKSQRVQTSTRQSVVPELGDRDADECHEEEDCD